MEWALHDETPPVTPAVTPAPTPVIHEEPSLPRRYCVLYFLMVVSVLLNILPVAVTNYIPFDMANCTSDSIEMLWNDYRMLRVLALVNFIFAVVTFHMWTCIRW